MAKRVRPIQDPVSFSLDGETLMAERGEPIAFALLGADKIALSRSPKLHRPHGPCCLRGACDGCLARVDGDPDVMTCMVPCKGGEKVETQNVLGSRKVDLLRVSDWFFPHGIDHHHLLAGVPGLSAVMQTVARRIAGLGRLPDLRDFPAPAEPAARYEADVLIVGAGAAGLTVAGELAKIQTTVLVVDDAPEPGGSLRARAPETIADRLGRAVRRPQSCTLLSSTTAAGCYEGEVLLVSLGRAALVRPRCLVLATGVHDGILAFEGNDLPGVISARAAALLLAGGVAIGDPIALVDDERDPGPYARALLDRAKGSLRVIRVPRKARIRVHGRSRVRSISVSQGKQTARHDVDAVVVEMPGSPSFELSEQAGATALLDLARGGYLPATDESGRAGDRLWCAGEAAGTGPVLASIVAQAERVAQSVTRSLASP